MSRWEIAALCALGYTVGAALSAAYLVSRGVSTGKTFDGFSGTESEGVKAVEAIALWPAALVVTLARR